MSDLKIAMCPHCGADVHTRDMFGQLPRTAFVLTALIVHMSVLDTLLQGEGYEPALEGWAQRLDMIQRWADAQHMELDEFAEAYDEENEETDD